MHQTKCSYFPFLFSLSFLQSFFSFSASSLFGTQYQLIHPPVKSSTLPLRKMPIIQGVAHRQTNFTLSSVISLWDSATSRSPSSKELNLSSREDTRFSGRCALACKFHFILRHPLWDLPSGHQTSFGRSMDVYMKSGLHIDVYWTSKGRLMPIGQHQLNHSLVKSSTTPPRKMPDFQTRLGTEFSLHPASSLFGTQQQLTQPPVKSSTLPLRNMPISQSVVPWHANFTLSCVSPL